MSHHPKEFELHVGGELMQRQAERGVRAGQDENGAMRPVAPAEIKVRLNNWQKIRAERLHGAVFAALSLGISLTCLVVGIARQVQGRKENRSAS
ncbi:MAG: hypothetical protein ACTFAL_08240 [Candidatus Electronema sp. V4]|uniref:hypothetical protein n=1 Tax=Candidatus Electronema sp. V4 TaxID=3454756 RepID=UPI004055517D